MKLQVTDHEYMNSGGGCMVSIFTIYDARLNRTLYLMINEEGGSLSTADYIRTELEFDDNMLLDNFNIDNLEPTDNNFKLFRDCFMEYVKKDCKRYDYKKHLTYDMLPDNLQQELTAEYLKWHYENIGNTFETDGYDLFISEEYVEPDAAIIQAKETLQYMKDVMYEWHNALDESLNEKFYNLDATVTFGSKTFTIKNCAAIYNAIQSCIKEFIDNY